MAKGGKRHGGKSTHTRDSEVAIVVGNAVLSRLAEQISHRENRLLAPLPTSDMLPDVPPVSAEKTAELRSKTRIAWITGGSAVGAGLIGLAVAVVNVFGQQQPPSPPPPPPPVVIVIDDCPSNEIPTTRNDDGAVIVTCERPALPPPSAQPALPPPPAQPALPAPVPRGES